MNWKEEKSKVNLRMSLGFLEEIRNVSEKLGLSV